MQKIIQCATDEDEYSIIEQNLAPYTPPLLLNDCESFLFLFCLESRLTESRGQSVTTSFKERFVSVRLIPTSFSTVWSIGSGSSLLPLLSSVVADVSTSLRLAGRSDPAGSELVRLVKPSRTPPLLVFRLFVSLSSPSTSIVVTDHLSSPDRNASPPPSSSTPSPSPRVRTAPSSSLGSSSRPA